MMVSFASVSTTPIFFKKEKKNLVHHHNKFMTTVSSAFVLAVEMYISHSNNALIKSLRDRAL